MRNVLIFRELRINMSIFKGLRKTGVCKSLIFSGFFFFSLVYPLFYPLRLPKVLILCGVSLLHMSCFENV